MPNPGAIRAGGAYVELEVADKTAIGYTSAENRLRAYNHRVAQLQRQQGVAAAGVMSPVLRINRDMGEAQDSFVRQAESYKRSMRAIALAKQATMLGPNSAGADEFVRMVESRKASLRQLEQLRKQQLVDERRQSLALAGLMAGAPVPVPSGAARGPSSRGISPAVDRRRLFGEESPLRRSVNYLATSAGASLGGEIGLAASNIAMLGATGGAIAAGIMVIGSAYKDAQERAAKLVETQKKYNAEVSEAAKFLKDLTPSQTTATGKAIESRMAAVRQQMEEIKAEAAAETKPWYSFAPKDRASAQDIAESKRYDRARRELMDLKDMAAQQQRYYDAAEQRATDVASIQGEADGPAKRRALLLARQNEEAHKMVDGHENEPMTDATRAMLKRHQIELANDERQTQREIIKDQQDAETAQINLKEVGFARELALLKQKHRNELAEYEKAVRLTAPLLARQAAERQKLIEDNARENADRIAAMNRAANVALQKMSEAQAKSAEIAQGMRGQTPEQIKATQDASRNADLAASMASGLDAIRDPGRMRRSLQMYGQDLGEALGTGMITGRQAQALLAAKAAGMMPTTSVSGTFNAMATQSLQGGSGVMAQVASGINTVADLMRKVESYVRNIAPVYE